VKHETTTGRDHRPTVRLAGADGDQHLLVLLFPAPSGRIRDGRTARTRQSCLGRHGCSSLSFLSCLSCISSAPVVSRLPPALASRNLPQMAPGRLSVKVLAMRCPARCEMQAAIEKERVFCRRQASECRRGWSPPIVPLGCVWSLDLTSCPVVLPVALSCPPALAVCFVPSSCLPSWAILLSIQPLV